MGWVSSLGSGSSLLLVVSSSKEGRGVVSLPFSCISGTAFE